MKYGFHLNEEERRGNIRDNSPTELTTLPPLPTQRDHRGPPAAPMASIMA